MIYHLNFSYYEKKSKFQVKFHVFCKFEKKAWFIPILAARVGLKRTQEITSFLRNFFPLGNLK